MILYFPVITIGSKMWKTFFISLLWLAAASEPVVAQTSPRLSYSELVSLNVSCSPKDTCVRELSKSRDLESLNDRNCACDSACTVYGDCCVDAPALATKPASSVADTLGWTCRNLTQFGGIIMKNRCPADWTGAESVRQMCESEEETAQSVDPFAVMPVTNRLTGTTYHNYHCAFCNGDTAHSLIWLPRLEFDTLDTYNRTFQNVTKEYITRNLLFLEKSKSWGVRLYGQDGRLHDHSAKIYPMIPKEAEGLVRLCRKSLISTCQSTWFDSTVRAKCSSYEAAIYLHDLTRNLGFRNAHCAMCNFVDLSKLVCKPPAAKSEVELRTFNFQSLSLIVDFNDARGSQVGQKDLCHEGEIYDPFQKTCRNVVCGFPGYVLVNNKCVLPQTATTTTTSLPTTTTTTTLPPTTTTTTTSLPPTTTTTTTATTTTTTTSPTTTTETSTITTWPFAPPTFTTSTRDPETTEIPVEDGSTEDPAKPLKYDTGTTEEISVQVVTISKDKEPSTTVSPKREDNSEKSASMREVISSPVTTVPAPFYSQDFIECPKVPVQSSKIEALPNGTIYVIPYDKFYGPSEYLFSGNEILVCAFFINNTQTEQAKFSSVLGYITVVGLSISMFCLVLHLIAFVVVPDLQNISTRNLSSFALSLFFAYFCFTIGNISTLSKLSCVTLAVTTCYFFLVSFFWMNTMSYDVWRTLRLATQELRVSSGNQWKRFVLYSAYSWGFPAGIVSAALVVDNVAGVPDEYRPGFGARICWFSERKALLVFFAAPLIAIMLANICFFVSSAKMILSTSRATSSHCSASSRRNFKLYLRLGVMMGLTWTFGVVAGYLDLETLWYIFILLNTLQGLFIFVAFTCNRKVRKYFADRLRSVGNGRQAYRSSSLNSGSGFNSNSTFPSSNTTAGSKTMSSQLNDTKTTIASPEKTMHASPMTSPPDRPVTSFKHLQAGMETLY